MRGHRLQRKLAPTVGILVAAVLCAAGPAQADVGQTIIRRCAEGKSVRGYTRGDYAKALKEMSTTTAEYSPCYQQISTAMEAAARGGGSSGGPPSAAPLQAVAATPAEQRSIAKAASTGSEPVRLGEGEPIHPGVVHADISSALSTLPAPVLALLAFLAACLLAFAGSALRKRARDGRAD